MGQITGSKELILKAEQIVIADNIREYSINDDFAIGAGGSCSLDGKHFNPRISYRDNDVSFVLSPDVLTGLKDIRDFATNLISKIRDGKIDDKQEISFDAPPPPPGEDGTSDKQQQENPEDNKAKDGVKQSSPEAQDNKARPEAQTSKDASTKPDSGKQGKEVGQYPREGSAESVSGDVLVKQISYLVGDQVSPEDIVELKQKLAQTDTGTTPHWVTGEGKSSSTKPPSFTEVLIHNDDIMAASDLLERDVYLNTLKKGLGIIGSNAHIVEEWLAKKFPTLKNIKDKALAITSIVIHEDLKLLHLNKPVSWALEKGDAILNRLLTPDERKGLDYVTFAYSAKKLLEHKFEGQAATKMESVNTGEILTDNIYEILKIDKLKASNIVAEAKKLGWKELPLDNGPRTFIDNNGVVRLKIKHCNSW
ncbi:hypothetical protein MIDIC_230148 [Alphaproteobacteria bacterium]